MKTINPRVSTKPLPNDAKSPLPVDVHGSKKLLLKHFDAFRPSVHTNTLSVFIENALILKTLLKVDQTLRRIVDACVDGLRSSR